MHRAFLEIDLVTLPVELEQGLDYLQIVVEHRLERDRVTITPVPLLIAAPVRSQHQDLLVQQMGSLLACPLDDGRSAIRLLRRVVQKIGARL
jgi:hypothetical protein